MSATATPTDATRWFLAYHRDAYHLTDVPRGRFLNATSTGLLLRDNGGGPAQRWTLSPTSTPDTYHLVNHSAAQPLPTPIRLIPAPFENPVLSRDSRPTSPLS